MSQVAALDALLPRSLRRRLKIRHPAARPVASNRRYPEKNLGTEQKIGVINSSAYHWLSMSDRFNCSSHFDLFWFAPEIAINLKIEHHAFDMV
jgi:hypothetical protein